MSNILSTIGNTPLVTLKKINPNPQVTIKAKLEFFNPSGSIKDRIVAHIIKQAEKEGLLKPGGTIIENTSGNTGAAIAMIAAVKGYQAILVMPDKVSTEKQNALRAFGAKVITTPTSAPPGSPQHYESVAKKLAQEIKNSFYVNQYDNLYNRQAHYLTTGPEIWQQCDGKIDYFIASGSTGGTVSGAGQFLKEKNPQLKIIMPDPIGSLYYHYFHTNQTKQNKGCTYLIEGIGEDHLTANINFELIDDVWQVSDQKAFQTARLLAQKEGILAGGSSGANIWATIRLAQSLSRPATIVTILPDSGLKYLSKIYNDEWMKQNNLL